MPEQPAALPTPAPTPDVLVVGAGPVGLALAVDLARRGVAVRVVDTLATPTTESRAIVVHSRTLDHLQALGVVDAVLERAVVSRGMDLYADGRRLAHVGFDGIDAVHPYSVSLLQTDTEAVLTARLAELGVHVERSTTLTALDARDDGVVATVTAPDGTAATIEAAFVVGTDGARSTVRHLLGLRLEGSFAGEDFLLGDVDGDHDYDPSCFHTFFSPGEATGLLFPLPGDRARVFAQLPPGVDPDRPVTVEWLQEALDERGVRLRVREAHWLTRLRLKHGQVPRYRVGRVFLAGDAAHIHSPAGGLGMNTGIHDAVNLGWKLALAVASGRTGTLLDSYEAERHPVGADVIALSTRLTRLGTLRNPVAQRVRNLVLHLGLESTSLDERLAARVEQQRVRYAGSPVVAGHGRTVHPGDFLRLPRTQVADALARTSGHLAVVLPRDWPRHLAAGVTELEVTEKDEDALTEATGLTHGGIVVVRPDGYVGFVGDDPKTGVAQYLALLDG